MAEDKLENLFTQYKQAGGGSSFDKFLKNTALFAEDKGHSGHEIAIWV